MQGADILKVAQAADWLDNPEQAVEAYDKAMAAGAANQPAVLQRLIEILLVSPKRDWDKIDGYINRLLAEAAGDPDTLLRAVQWKMQRLLGEDQIDQAKALLKSVAGKLDVPPWSHHLQAFDAQIDPGR